MHRGTYSFLGNGLVFKAHFQVVALQAVSNVQAREHVRQQGMGPGAREKVVSRARCCTSEPAKYMERSATIVSRFGWELQMTGSGHRIGRRRSKASQLPSPGTLSAASPCSARCLPRRRVCAKSTRPNLAGPLRHQIPPVAKGSKLPQCLFQGVLGLSLRRDPRFGRGCR